MALHLLIFSQNKKLAEFKWVNEKLVTSQLLGSISAADNSFLPCLCGGATLLNGRSW